MVVHLLLALYWAFAVGGLYHKQGRLPVLARIAEHIGSVVVNNIAMQMVLAHGGALACLYICAYQHYGRVGKAKRIAFPYRAIYPYKVQACRIERWKYKRTMCTYHRSINRLCLHHKHGIALCHNGKAAHIQQQK